jgi:hypothetical protein
MMSNPSERAVKQLVEPELAQRAFQTLINLLGSEDEYVRRIAPCY